MTMSLDDQLAAYGDTIDDAVDHHLAGSQPPEHTPPVATRRPHTAVRARRWLVAAAVAVVAAAAGGVLAFWPSSASPAWAGWTPAAESVPAAEADAIDSFCRRATSVGEMEPLIVDVRGSGAVAVYGNSSGWITCHVHRGPDGGDRLAATTSNRGDDLAAARTAVRAGAPVAVLGLGWQGDPAASLIWGVRADPVDTVHIATEGEVVEASTSGDIWIAWWPQQDAPTARLRAVGADGSVLVEGAAGELAPALPLPSTIAAAVDADGTALEREVLADGIVTWPEFVTALDAWKACVAADGYDLIIEVDDARRSTRVISPVVSVEAPAGEPDDAAAHQLLEPIDASILDCRRVHVSRIEQFLVQQ